MCGIAAIFSFKDGIGIDNIDTMTHVVRHRGPDDEGYVFFCADGGEAVCLGGKDSPAISFNNAYPYTPEKQFVGGMGGKSVAALGHRRLSIIDLSPAGHQPMCTLDGRYWIVYNGEIYNYVELRRELIAAGYSFRSHSDTEVILNAYRHWQSECLHQFNGMFAFVLVDREERKVFVARDRFGIKPLYYWTSPCGFLAIASEIKQFTVLPGWRAELNGQRAYDFLNWGLSDHTNETLFSGVRQIRGGEFAECAFSELTRGLPVKTWYTLSPRPVKGNLEDSAVSLRETLSDSVRLRLRADVPVGFCLSGGLDSSSIVCIANEWLSAQGVHNHLKAFSACAEVKSFDEREFIEEVVRNTGIDVHYTYPAIDELFDTLGEITFHQDEPFNSSSIYAQWHVFKLGSHNGIKVMLDGQGADEQLAGYYGFFGSRFADLFRRLRWWRLWQEMRETERLHGIHRQQACKHIANILLPETPRQIMRRVVGKVSTQSSWINMKLLGAKGVDPYAVFGAIASTVNALSHSQLMSTSLPMLLHWEDRNSMAHSIESRLPFLDYRLVELVLGLPDDYKVSEGITKRVLREGMKGCLPEQIRMRMDKMGFGTPEEIWIKERCPDIFRSELVRAIEAAQGVLNKELMGRLEAMIAGKEPFSFLVWRTISFGRWMEQYNVSVR